MNKLFNVWLFSIWLFSALILVQYSFGSPCDKKEFHWNVYRTGTPLIAPKRFIDDVSLLTDWLLEFPEIKPDGTIINGGVPQRADIGATRNKLRNLIAYWGRTPDFNGWVVLDFEKHMPQWERAPNEYQEFSISLVRKNHPRMSRDNAVTLARKEWESASIKYWLGVIEIVRELRPKARVAYFDLMARVYWNGYATPNGPELRRINNKVNAIHRASDAVFADIYQFYPSNEFPQTPYERNRQYVAENIGEALRLGKLTGKPVFAYMWHRYHDSAPQGWAFKFVKEPDLFLQMVYPLALGAKGVFVWGNELAQYDSWLGNMQPFIDGTLTDTLNSFCGVKK